jgi:hypothetical protein
VVKFVLENSGQPSLSLDLVPSTVFVLGTKLHDIRTLQGKPLTGNGKATFGFGLFVCIALLDWAKGQFGVDCYPSVLRFTVMPLKDENSTIYANLRGCKPHARGLSHGLEHIREQRGQFWAKNGHGLGWSVQNRVAGDHYGLNCHHPNLSALFPRISG